MKKAVISWETDSIRTYLLKIWSKRALILTFTRRDFKIKYAQTWMGFGWTLVQPIIGVAIFTIFFTKIFKMDTGTLPYPIFAYLGLSSWSYFINIFYQGSTSLMDNQELIKKVYFPKIILPISKIFTCGIDFFLTVLILIVALPFFDFTPTWHILLFPFFVVLNIIVGFTAAIWLAALALKKRDLFHIVPFISNFGMWLTPIFYTMNVFPKPYSYIFYFNPMATVVEGYRWCLRGGAWPDHLLWVNIFIVLLFFVTGVFYFRKIEDKMVERI